MTVTTEGIVVTATIVNGVLAVAGFFVMLFRRQPPLEQELQRMFERIVREYLTKEEQAKCEGRCRDSVQACKTEMEKLRQSQEHDRDNIYSRINALQASIQQSAKDVDRQIGILEGRLAGHARSQA